MNRKEVRESLLNDGDVIRAGKTDILVRIDLTATGPGPDDGAGPRDHDDWETEISGECGPLKCQACGELASGTHLNDVQDLHVITYVCVGCWKKWKGEDHSDQPIPNYQKLGILANKSLGPVYKARRVSTGKVVVLKVFDAQRVPNATEAIRVFLRQMMYAARLRHPRIVPIVEMGQAGPVLWIASEFVDGLDARELTIKQGRALPVRDAVDIVCQILDPLDHAHRRNLVHRDINPSNILVAGRPGAYDAQLSDLGLLKNMDEAGVSQITPDGRVRGTRYFMPPEQILSSRDVKHYGDIYSAAATLYWLLTGEHTRNFGSLDGRGEKRSDYLIILEDAIVPLREPPSRDSRADRPGRRKGPGQARKNALTRRTRWPGRSEGRLQWPDRVLFARVSLTPPVPRPQVSRPRPGQGDSTSRE